MKAFLQRWKAPNDPRYKLMFRRLLYCLTGLSAPCLAGLALADHLPLFAVVLLKWGMAVSVGAGLVSWFMVQLTIDWNKVDLNKDVPDVRLPT